MRHLIPWVSQLYCKSAHISLILLILSLFDDPFHLLTFQKLVFKVCSYLVESIHRTVSYLICYWNSSANLSILHTPICCCILGDIILACLCIHQLFSSTLYWLKVATSSNFAGVSPQQVWS